MTRADALCAMLVKVGPDNIGLAFGAAVTLAIFREPVMFGYLGGIVTAIITKALTATEDN